MKNSTEKNKYKDGNYSFENSHSFARKNVVNDHVKLNDGTLVHVDDFVKRNKYVKFDFKF